VKPNRKTPEQTQVERLRNRSLFIALPLTLLALFAWSSAIILPSHGTSPTGLVCLADPASVSPPPVRSCPTSPYTFSGPFPSTPQTLPTQLQVGVYVNGSDALNGFDITLMVDHTILTPAGVDLTGTILPGAPTITVECISGVYFQSCATTDNVDTLHLAVSAGPSLTTPPTTGLLFTAIYNITGMNAAGSPVSVGFQTGCVGTSVGGGTCVTILNGSTPDTETVQTGTTFDNSAGTIPWIAVTSNTTSITVPKGSTSGAHVGITATAENSWPSLSRDRVNFTSVMTQGFPAPSFAATSCSTGGTSCTITVAMNTTFPGNYTVTIFGSYVANDTTGTGLSDTLSGAVMIEVSVQASVLAVVQASNGDLWWSRYSSNTWSGWQQLSGPVNSPPALCSSGPGTVELLLRGTNNATFHRTFSGGSWGSWDLAGGLTYSQPACAVLNGVLYLAVRGTDNATWINTMTVGSGTWDGWTDIGGVIQYSPVLVASPGRLDLLVVGMDNGGWHKLYTATTNLWSSSWDNAGGTLIGPVTAVSDGTSLHIVAASTGGSITHGQLDFAGQGSWSGWSPLGGATASTPSLTVDGFGTVHLVVRGLNDVVYHQQKESGQAWNSTWDSGGFSTVDQPAFLTQGSIGVAVLRAPDNGLYYNIFLVKGGGQPKPWTSLAGATSATPEIASL